MLQGIFGLGGHPGRTFRSFRCARYDPSTAPIEIDVATGDEDTPVHPRKGRSLNSLSPCLLEPILLKGTDSAEGLVVGLSVFLRGVFDGRQLDCA